MLSSWVFCVPAAQTGPCSYPRPWQNYQSVLSWDTEKTKGCRFGAFYCSPCLVQSGPGRCEEQIDGIIATVYLVCQTQCWVPWIQASFHSHEDGLFSSPLYSCEDWGLGETEEFAPDSLVSTWKSWDERDYFSKRIFFSTPGFLFSFSSFIIAEYSLYNIFENCPISVSAW